MSDFITTCNTASPITSQQQNGDEFQTLLTDLDDIMDSFDADLRITVNDCELSDDEKDKEFDLSPSSEIPGSPIYGQLWTDLSTPFGIMPTYPSPSPSRSPKLFSRSIAASRPHPIHQQSELVPINIEIDGRIQNVLIEKNWTASDVCHKIVEVNNFEQSIDWSIIEVLVDIHLERCLEDHDVVISVIQSWAAASHNVLIFCNNRLKYDFFNNALKYFHPKFFIGKAKEKAVSDRAEQMKTFLVEKLLSDTDKVPEFKGSMHVSSFKKARWKKRYFHLRSSGLYYSKRGKSKDIRDMVQYTPFECVRLYVGTKRFRKVHRAPRKHCFCLIPNIAKEWKQLKCFSASSDEILQSWIVGFRLAKYGSELRESYRTASRRHQKLKELLENTTDLKEPRTPTKTTLTPISSTSVKDKGWFHGTVGREDAEKMLVRRGFNEGMFLVRESTSSTGILVLSAVRNGKVIHYEILQGVGANGAITYSFQSGPDFTNLPALVDYHYGAHLSGKPPLLKEPCIKDNDNYLYS